MTDVGQEPDQSTGNRRLSSRIPTLPTFRATSSNTENDAFEFLDHCRSLLDAHGIPEKRWVSDILPSLSSFDRQWANINLKGKAWAEVEKEFLSLFETPALRDQLMKELMTITMSKKESVQQYSVRFTSLMRRTGKRDDDDTLIAVYINGLDSRLQEMMHVARATNLHIRSANGLESFESVSWEIQNAIALDAARTTAQDPKSTDTKTQKPRCGTCRKPGHTTAEHRDDYRQTPSTSKKQDKPEKKCFKSSKPWKPGHTCHVDIQPQNANMEVDCYPCIFDTDDAPFGSGLATAIAGEIAERNTTELPEDSRTLLYTPVTINGIDGAAMVDSGATAMFISQHFVDIHSFEIKPRCGIIKAGKGTTLGRRIGIVYLIVCNGSKKVPCEADVMEMPAGRDLVIGISHFREFGYQRARVPVKKPGVENENFNEKDKQHEEATVDGFTAKELHKDVATAVAKNKKLPTSSFFHHPLAVLHVQPVDTEPIWRKINFVLNEDAERVTEKVSEWISDDVIEHAPADCVYCFSLLGVPKKDSQGCKVDIRPGLDLRPLNSRLPDVKYPMPKIQEIFNKLGSAHGPNVLFTTIDLRDSYFRFTIPETGRNWIAFKWKNVHYRFKRAPFGVKTMGAQLQRLMDAILTDLLFVGCYVDDIIVFSNNLADHIEHTQIVLERLTHWKLPIKVSKCRFGQKMVRLLEFIVSENGVNMDPATANAIMKWQRPSTPKQLTRF